MQNKRMFVHDYTRVGFYMITILTANRRPLFGVCRGNRVELSLAGETVKRRWQYAKAWLHRRLYGEDAPAGGRADGH